MGRPIMGLLKRSRTMQKEIKETIAFFLKIVANENNDWTLWTYPDEIKSLEYVCTNKIRDSTDILITEKWSG